MRRQKSFSRGADSRSRGSPYHALLALLLFTTATAQVSRAGIYVTGTNGATIASGTATTSDSNGTHFHAMRVLQGMRQHTFTLRHDGAGGTVQINSVGIEGANPGDFVVVSNPSGSLPKNSSRTFVIGFDPTAIGQRSAVFRIVPGNPTPNYTFAISGLGVEPEITVLGTNHAAVLNGETTSSAAAGTYFGDAHVVGETVERTFFITNSGTAMLTVTNAWLSGVHAADFSVAVQPPTSIQTNSRATFTVRFNPSLRGVRSAVLHVGNDDMDESDYDFVIEGRGIEPEIAVLGTNLSEIPAGSAVPESGNGTDFGEVRLSGASQDRVFTITNSETAVLYITGVSVSGSHSADFSVLSSPASSVLPGQSTTFTIRFDPNSLGTRSATIRVSSDDADEAEYDFAIQGWGYEPEIAVLGTNGALIVDGEGSASSAKGTDFGATRLFGGAISRTYTITNSGNGTLQIAGISKTGLNPNDFIVVSEPASTISAGGTSTFTVQFSPLSLGLRIAALHVINDDTDESDYDFVVRGSGVEPEIAVLGTNLVLIATGDMMASAADGTDFGDHRVASGFRDNTFSITNAGTTTLNVSGITTSGTHTADFVVIAEPAAALAPGASTTFTVRFDPNAIGTRSAVLHVLNDDADEDDYYFALAGRGLEPEIAILGTNLATIASGDITPELPDGTDFGAVSRGEWVDHVFTITNAGSYSLAVSGVETSGVDSLDFTIVSAPASSVSAGQAATFSVRFEPGDSGLRTAVIHVINDDLDEADYSFAVQGTGIEPEISVLGTNLSEIVSGDATPSLSDGTDFGNVREFNSWRDVVFAITNSGSATLEIAGITTSGSHASDFTIEAFADSSIPPNSAGVFTLRFNPGALGLRSAIVSIDNNDLDEPDYTFSVQGTGVEPEIAVLGTNGVAIPAGEPTTSPENGTDFGAHRVAGGMRDHIFSVTNSGTTVLNISGVSTSGVHAGDFVITAVPAATVSPNESTTFTVRFDPSALGARSATIRVLNDDADESDYFFSVSGSGIEPEIALLGTNYALIASGDAMPSSGDGTDFGSHRVAGGFRDHVFAITNSGDAVLNIGALTTNGAHAADFVVVSLPSSQLSPGAATTLAVRFDPTALGLRSAVFHIASDDADESDYWFAVQGIGVEPEIGILGTNLAPIAHGDASPDTADGSDFAEVREYNSWRDHTFTITNSGTWELNFLSVSTSGTAQADFIVVAAPAVVPVGGTATFTVRFDPSALGLRSAAIHVESDDANTPDYSFAIQGMGVEPEIAVLGTNSALISYGDAVPDVEDGTDFGQVREHDAWRDHVFTVTNSGACSLNVAGVITGGAHAAEFTVVALPASPIAPGGTTTFTVRFDPAGLGLRTAFLEIPNDDADEADYFFHVQGTGVEPEIAVLGTNGVEIACYDVTPSTSDGTHFGEHRVVGGFRDHIFTITNSGTSALTISGVTTNGSNPGDFVVISYPASTVPIGGSTSFSVRFDPSSLGSRSTVIHIANDDADEPDYSFAVEGTGVEPEIAVLGTNFAVIASGDSSPSTADGTDFGTHRVAGGFGDHVFTITNSGTTVLNITGVTTNGSQADEFVITAPPPSSIGAGDVATFSVRFDPAALGVRSAELRIANDDADEGDYYFSVSGVGAEPEVALLGTNGSEIVRGDVTPSTSDGTDFGNVREFESWRDHAFTITNSGTYILNISGVTTSGVDSADFVVVVPPSPTVAAGGKTTFTLRFNPSALGERNAVVEVLNDDDDEPDYFFSVRGTGVEPEVAVLGTNGAAIAAGEASPTAAKGTDFGSHRVAGGFRDHVFAVTNSGTTVLNISGVTTNGAHPGDFQVTVPPGASVPPGGFTTFTVRFDPNALELRSAVLHVANDDADEPDYFFSVQGTGVEPEIAVLGTNSAEIASGDITPSAVDGTDFGSIRVVVGTVTRIYSITNSGTTTLNIDGVVTNGAQKGDFTVITAPASVVAPGGITTFAVRFDAQAIGLRSATVHVLNDDADEPDYHFAVQGTGIEPEIRVLGTNSAHIVADDVTPSEADGTDFGPVRMTFGSKEHIFTITNAGTADLNITAVTKDGLNHSEFALVTLPDTLVPPGESTTFTVRFSPLALGQRVAAIHVISDDANHGTYNFAIRGTGAEPEIALLGIDGSLISDGSAVPAVLNGTDFEEVRVFGGMVDRVFTITNSGTCGLRVTGVSTSGAQKADFIVVSPPPTNVAAGASATFTVRIDPSALGARSAVIHISNDDEDEGDYDFAVRGFGVEPEIAVLGTNNALIAHGDMTPSAADGTEFGSARVLDGLVERSFTVTNSGSTLLNVSNVTMTGANPADFLIVAQPATQIVVGGVSVFTVRFDPSDIGERSAVVNVPNDDADEPDYSFAVRGTGVEPEIAVLGTNGTEIARGDMTPASSDGTDFGSIRVLVESVERTFTVTNSGSMTLTVTGVTTGGAHAADFSIVTAPSGTVAAGHATTFTVRFHPSADGLRSAVINVMNDDVDEGEYSFAIQGTGVQPEAVVLGTNMQEIACGETTTRIEDGTDFGDVRVFNGLRDHTFTITNSGSLVLLVTNVSLAGPHADDFAVMSVPAASVDPGETTTFTIRFTPSVLGERQAVVHVANDDLDESDYSFALSGTGVEPEIEVLGTNLQEIACGETTTSRENGSDFGRVRVFNGTREHVFTVTNSGTAVLNIQGVTTNGTNPGDFIVISAPAAAVAPRSATTFTVRFDPSALEGRSAVIHVLNDDADEPDYDFAVSGTGVEPEIVVLGTNMVEIVCGHTAVSAANGTHFGLAVPASGAVKRVFTIMNTGSWELELTGTPRVEIIHGQVQDFVVSAQPAALIQTNSTTTFEISFDPWTMGVSTATVSIANSDADEDPYLFAIAGIGPTQQIANIGVDAPDLTGASIAWGDFNGDGRLDYALAGFDGTSRVTRLFRNDGPRTFTEVSAGLVGVENAKLAWVDFDNNGALDLLVAGYDGTAATTRLYMNEFGVLADSGYEFEGVSGPAMAWGDYDNNGLPDLALAGRTETGRVTIIYQNTGAGFTNINAMLPGVDFGSLAWIDYDGDMDLDLVVVGDTESSKIARIYRNNNGVFSNVTTVIQGVSHGAIAAGDWDNDEDIDLLICGYSSTGSITRLYNNSGSGSFTNSNVYFPGAWMSSAAWGDFNNNGRLDLAITGLTSNGPIAAVYLNNGNGTFSNACLSMTAMWNGQLAWGDYDCDGDLDLLSAGSVVNGYSTRLYRNYATHTNTPPNPPTGLNAVQTGGSEITFSWEAGSDVETPTNGLTYSLSVGTGFGFGDVMTMCADVSDGHRLIPGHGNVLERRSWKLRDLPVGSTLYWEVQTIDAGFAGSVVTGSTVTLAESPDFVIANLEVTPMPFSAQVTVSNSGTVAGDAGLLSLWLNRTSPVSCGEAGDAAVEVGTLEPGESVEVTLTGLTGIAGETNRVLVFADSGCETMEYNEDNNQAESTFVLEETQGFWFRAVALTDTIYLRWADPEACGFMSPTVHIRYSTTDYPALLTDGNALYTGGDQVYVHGGLDSLQPYFYTIWVSNDGEVFFEPPE